MRTNKDLVAAKKKISEMEAKLERLEILIQQDEMLLDMVKKEISSIKEIAKNETILVQK